MSLVSRRPFHPCPHIGRTVQFPRRMYAHTCALYSWEINPITKSFITEREPIAKGWPGSCLLPQGWRPGVLTFPHAIQMEQ